MINAVLVFNNSGQPRLTKFYTQLDTTTQQSLLSQIFTLVSARPRSACSFLPLPPLLSQNNTIPNTTTTTTSTSNTTTTAAATTRSRNISGATNPSSAAKPPPSPYSDAPSQITYRHYATLYFILISTSTESPLALLDLIQVFVEALDRLFENVCELDLIFGFETLHAVLGEMVVGGVVVETGLDRIVDAVRAAEGSSSSSSSKGKRRALHDAGLGPGSGLAAGAGGAIRALGWAGGGGLGGWR